MYLYFYIVTVNNPERKLRENLLFITASEEWNSQELDSHESGRQKTCTIQKLQNIAEKIKEGINK